MKKGKLTRKENSWWIENDDTLYPLSLTSSYYAGFSLKEGKEVNFKVETEIYIDSEFHEKTKVDWAVIESNITRVEIINQNSDKHPIGRIFNYQGGVEVSFQDGGKTLKIFI